LANPAGWAESEVERVQDLIKLEVDALLRCPAEGKEVASHEALSRLEPHLRRVLKTLETIERARVLTEEELARRGAFMLLLDTASQPGHGQTSHCP
jgi:hypothetical protein